MSSASERHESSKFGGRQFTHQLEACSQGLTDILRQILNAEVKNLPDPVGVILGNIHHNATAILTLTPDALLSEAYLVMRVMVDASLTAGYLIVVDDKERKAYTAKAYSGNSLQSGGPDELIQQASTLRNLDLVPPHCLKPLDERLAVVSQATGTNPDTWRVVVASIYPHSTELLAGSPHAYNFRFRIAGAQGEANGPGGEFSMLFLMGSEVLYELVGLCGRHVNVERWKADADSLRQKVHAVMKARDAGIEDPSEGSWDGLTHLEHSATHTLAVQLEAFEAAFRDTYKAGLIVPVLRAKGRSIVDVKCAALFFKRVLNDLRGVWVLLHKGYTSQAASVAASLYECALATICLTHSKENIRAFEAEPHGKIPWKPMKMAQMVVRAEGKAPPSKDYENGWRSLYSHYVWLCQIKHAGQDSVVHDTIASTLPARGYVVMAIPNVKDEDIGIKAMVAIISLRRTLESIEAFATALGFGDKLPDDYRFAERFNRARESAWKAFEPHLHEVKSISIARSWFVDKYPPVK